MEREALQVTRMQVVPGVNVVIGAANTTTSDLGRGRHISRGEGKETRWWQGKEYNLFWIRVVAYRFELSDIGDGYI